LHDPEFLPAAAPDAPVALRVRFAIEAELAFDIDVSIDVHQGDTRVAHAQLGAQGWDVAWLPRGEYLCHALAPRSGLPAGEYALHIALWHRQGGELIKAGATVLPWRVDHDGGSAPQWSFQLERAHMSGFVERLSWRRGHNDWFHKHFDHAARVVQSYMLDNSPLLRGRVLDVGCGDGITDLGVALRCQTREFVGVDPFRGYERLPEILRSAGLDPAVMPPSLRFEPHSANALPYADNHFDVVLSWGSLEHIVGGYRQALDEIRRVLRPGGLLFVHPGLYYSDIGNHLGEFACARAEPYVHLQRTREQLREMVLASQPDYIDRCGEFATPAQYWQWFTELNPITVGAFEQELRALDFEPWRVALRAHDRVDYTPALQRYSFVDLAIAELYVSAWNRKPA
jgi:SAM-dependent methyltransferase